MHVLCIVATEQLNMIYPRNMVCLRYIIVSTCTKVMTVSIIFFFVVIVIILYAWYLQLHTWNNHVSRVYSVAAVLYLQFVLHVM
jgi:hypothetical protein